MKRSKHGGEEGPVDLNKLRLLTPEIVLTPREVDEGCTVVNIPLGPEEHQCLARALELRGHDVGTAVRQAMLELDALSESVFVLQDTLLIREAETGVIYHFEPWPKADPS